MIIAYCENGLPIELFEDTDEIVYKDNKVPFTAIKSAMESGLDKVELTHNLTFIKTGGFVSFGCLTLSETKVKQLIKTVWKQLKEYNKVGN